VRPPCMRPLTPDFGFADAAHADATRAGMALHTATTSAMLRQQLLTARGNMEPHGVTLAKTTTEQDKGVSEPAKARVRQAKPQQISDNVAGKVAHVHAFKCLRKHLDEDARVHADFVFKPTKAWGKDWMENLPALQLMPEDTVELIRHDLAEYIEDLFQDKVDMIDLRNHYAEKARGHSAALSVVEILTHPEKYDTKTFNEHGGTLVGYLSMSTTTVMKVINQYFSTQIADFRQLETMRQTIHSEFVRGVPRKDWSLQVKVPTVRGGTSYTPHPGLVPAARPDLILGILPSVCQSRSSPLDVAIRARGFAKALSGGHGKSAAPNVAAGEHIVITPEVSQIQNLTRLMRDPRFPAQEVRAAFRMTAHDDSTFGLEAAENAKAAYKAGYAMHGNRAWTQSGKKRLYWPRPEDVVPRLGATWLTVSDHIDIVNERDAKKQAAGKPRIAKPRSDLPARRPPGRPPPKQHSALHATRRYARGLLRAATSRCLPFGLARFHASSLNFGSKHEYDVWHERHAGKITGVGRLPVNPALEYKYEGFTNYLEFLAAPAHTEGATLAFARASCFEAGCTDAHEWNEHCKHTHAENLIRPDGHRYNLPHCYNGTVGGDINLPFDDFVPQFDLWGDFIAKVKTNLTVSTVTRPKQWHDQFADSVTTTAHPEIAYGSDFRHSNGWTGLLNGANIGDAAFYHFPERIKVALPGGSTAYACDLYENIGTGLYVVVTPTHVPFYRSSFVGDLDAHGGYQFNGGLTELLTQKMHPEDPVPEALIVFDMPDAVRSFISTRNRARAAVNKDSIRTASSGLRHVREEAGNTREENGEVFMNARRQYQDAENVPPQLALQPFLPAEGDEKVHDLTQLWRLVLEQGLPEHRPNFTWNIGEVVAANPTLDNAVLLGMTDIFNRVMPGEKDPPSADYLAATYGGTMARMLDRGQGIDVDTFIRLLIGAAPIPNNIKATILRSGKKAATRRPVDTDTMVTLDDADAESNGFNVDGYYNIW